MLITEKICFKCYQIKLLAEFNTSDKKFTKFCKKCNNVSKLNYYYRNREKILELQKTDDYRKKKRNHYHENKDLVLKYLLLNRERVKKHRQKYYLKNKEKILLKSKLYHKINRSQVNTKAREKLKNNVKFRLIKRLRNRLTCFLKYKGIRKNYKFFQYIGCSIEELKIHLEKQFKPGMTWDNYGYYGWHIDHIIPLNSASTIEKLSELCHYTNLQPLWAKENISKKDRI